METEDIALVGTIVGALILLCLVVYAVVGDNNKAADKFFAACERDHQHYECQVMWGQAQGTR